MPGVYFPAIVEVFVFHQPSVRLYCVHIGEHLFLDPMRYVFMTSDRNSMGVSSMQLCKLNPLEERAASLAATSDWHK